MLDRLRALGHAGRHPLAEAGAAGGGQHDHGSGGRRGHRTRAEPRGGHVLPQAPLWSGGGVARTPSERSSLPGASAWEVLAARAVQT